MGGSVSDTEEADGSGLDAEARRQESALRTQMSEAERSRKAVLSRGDGEVGAEIVDLDHAKGLDNVRRKLLLDRAMETQDMDNDKFLHKIKARLDRVDMSLPEVEVAFESVSVSAEAFVADRALPSIPNYFLDLAERGLRLLWLKRQNRQQLEILKSASGRLKPGRFTLLLGPPGSGKSTLLKLLAGKLQGSNLKVEGDVTYNGFSFNDFVVQRTAAYIDQEDNHLPQLSVRQTLDFAARCQGAGFDELGELRRREKELGIEPDWEIDAFMKASNLRGKQQSIVTDYILRMLGLEVCESTVIGDQLVRGISGGQKKRVTTAEMLVSPKRVLLADEVSTGLDSSTTYQLVRCVRNFVHLRAATVLMSLLQPPPETFGLFDDVMLLSEGQIVYHGPREHVLEFFEDLGFRLPHRKGVADFLQEVTSRKDQRQFWQGKPSEYRYMTVPEIAAAFKESRIGKETDASFRLPKERTAQGREGLVFTKFALPWRESFKACLRREVTLMQRNSFLFIFRVTQASFVAFMMATLFIKPRMNDTTFAGGLLYLQLLFFSCYFMVVTNFSELAISVNQLSVFWKQRDNLFFPTTCHVLPTTLLRLPYSAVNSLAWTVIVYWAVGLTYTPGRFFLYLCICFLTHTVSVTQFRAIASLTRTLVLANISAFLLVLMAFLFGGLLIAKRDVPPWWRWAVWASPMYYAQKAISINEFHAPRWGTPYGSDPPETLGRAVLASADLDSFGLFILIGIGALVCYVVVYNIVITLAMKLLSSPDRRKAIIPSKGLAADSSTRSRPTSLRTLAGSAGSAGDAPEQPGGSEAGSSQAELRKAAEGPALESAAACADGSASECDTEGGMTLPFLPMLMTFTDICYYVDMPAGMAPAPSRKQKPAREDKGALRAKAERAKEPSFRSRPQLQLLNNIDGIFAPGVLTALMGATGAGKTTLMDVLAGRKTSGRITGEIKVNGFQQDLRTFKRVSGYCEQFDIHSPQSTVGEALWFSARLRLAPDVSTATMKTFMREIMDLVELTVIKDALVGKPGVSGLSVEQRKRLTIAVELVANPSIVFMDEPTSGLDARAAAIVMRVVRNICSTGRTICCTIHQPSIDVFEAFDELVLLKRGGVVIYSGKLGRLSADMIGYFESIPGVPPIAADFNPATWMLDISTISAEQKLGLDLADVYRESSLYRRNRELIDSKAQPEPGTQPLAFDREYPQPIWKQYFILLAKNSILYYRNPDYTAVRLIFTLLLGLVFGTALWDQGQDRSTRSALERVAAAQYLVVVFYGFTNSATVQPIVSYERLVFYRERFAGMYSSVPYAFAQGDVELPYLVVQAFLYSVVTYWLIRYEYSAAKFFWYTLFMLLSLAYYSFYGMMVVSLTETIATASTVSVIAYAVWNLMAGFVIPKPRVPGWWIWVLYINPAHWSFYGLVVGQLGDVSTTVQNDAGMPVTASEYIQETYGLDHSFIGWVALILVGFVVFFRAVTIFALCKFTFGKR